MKKVIRVSGLMLSVLWSAHGLAAVDMFIKISDVKGESRVVSCPGSICTLSNLAAGTYQVQVSDEQGSPLSSSFSLSHSVTSPRDSASGMATGKRMHKPMLLSKRVDKSSPQLFSLEVADTGSSVTILPQSRVSHVAPPVSSGKVSVQDLSVTR